MARSRATVVVVGCRSGSGLVVEAWRKCESGPFRIEVPRLLVVKAGHLLDLMASRGARPTRHLRPTGDAALKLAMALCLMTIGCVVIPSQLRGPRLEPDAPVCVVEDWSPAATMSPVGVLLRSPDLAVRQGHPFVAGLNLQLRDSTPLVEPFFLGSGSGEDIGRPAGDFQFLHPRIAFDSDDRMHLVWAEAEEPLRTGLDTAFPALVELWHATYHAGAWSRPLKLFDGARLYWSRERSGMFLEPESGVLNIVFDTFPIGGSGTGPTVLAKAREGSLLSLDTLALAGSPIYLGVTGRGASLEVAYVDWHRASDRTRVLSLSSHDAGTTWSDPEVVDQGTRGARADTWPLLDPVGDLHVLWIETEEDRLFGTSTLHHGWRAAGSSAWRFAEPFSLPAAVDNTKAVIDSCGGVHLVADVVDSAGLPRGRRSHPWSPPRAPLEVREDPRTPRA